MKNNFLSTRNDQGKKNQFFKSKESQSFSSLLKQKYKTMVKKKDRGRIDDSNQKKNTNLTTDCSSFNLPPKFCECQQIKLFLKKKKVKPQGQLLDQIKSLL